MLVTAASVQDSDAGQEVQIDLKDKMHRLEKVYADQQYKTWLVDGIARWQKFVPKIVTKPPEQRGFEVLPKR